MDFISRQLQPAYNNTEDSVLGSPAIEIYFIARDYEIYYSSITRRHESREAAKQVIPIFDQAIALLHQSNYQRIVDDLLISLAEKDVQLQVSEPPKANPVIEAALSRCPQECKFLEVEQELNEAWLKKQFGKLTKRYHPDVGGTDDLMRELNEAKDVIRDFLQNWIIQHPKQENVTEEDKRSYMTVENITVVRPNTCSNFLARLRVRLLAIYVDLWDVERSYTVWKEISADSQSISIDDARISLLLSQRLAKYLLLASGQTLTAQDVLRDARLLASQFDFGNFESYFSQECTAIETAAIRGKHGRIVLTHPLQAENAHHYGIIDQNKYTTLQKRFEEFRRLEEVTAQKLREYVEDIGFLPKLPTDKRPESNLSPDVMVPNPQYYGLHQHSELTDSHRVEYHHAFSVGDLLLIRKYTDVRLRSLLNSGVLHNDAPPLEALANECHFIGELQRKGVSIGGHSPAAFLEWLAALPYAEQKWRLKLIQALNFDEHQAFQMNQTFFRLYHSGVQPLYSCCVSLSPFFYKTMSLPKVEIKHIFEEQLKSI